MPMASEVKEEMLEGPLEIFAGVFYQQGYAISSTYLRTVGNQVKAQSWVVGVQDCAEGPPLCLEMMSLAHVLGLIDSWQWKKEGRPPAKTDVWISGEGLVDGLLSWFNTGTFPYEVAGSSEVVRLLTKLAGEFPGKLFFRAIPEGFYEQCDPEGIQPADVIVGTVNRTINFLQQIEHLNGFFFL